MSVSRQVNTSVSVPEPVDLLIAALRRGGAERSALAVLGESLTASESLATLKPRLTNLDAAIARKAPPDRSDELRRVEQRLVHLERNAKPGLLTRRGRDDRHRLEGLRGERNQLFEAQQRWQGWLDENAETFAYRDELPALWNGAVGSSVRWLLPPSPPTSSTCWQSPGQPL